jgi:hypothetical protein
MSEFTTMAKRPKKDETHLQQIGRTGDPVSAFYRAIIGKSARIHVPLLDVVFVRDAGEVLEGLGRKLKALSREKAPDHAILFAMRQEIKLADAKIRSQKALGKWPQKQ